MSATTAAGERALSADFLVDVLGDLVRTKSVNPGVFEMAMAERVQAWLGPTGAEITVVEMAPGRPSVAAVLGNRDGATRLVLNGHMDTVPIDDAAEWTVAPFGGEVKDGLLYGRGACDMKAGLATQIAVAHHLAPRADELDGALILHFAAGEECAEPGSLSLVEAGFTGDYGIVTEPTQLKVAVAERGLAYYRIRIRGRSIHASKAHLGLNPVRRLAPVLQTLADYDGDIKGRRHPLLPEASCTPTVVRGGVKENAVADYCDLLLDRRLLPGETVDGELDAMSRRLEGIKATDPDFDFEMEPFEHAFAPAEIPADSPFAGRVLDAVERVTGERPEVCGTPYASDVRTLVNDAGMEAVTFGPGNVAHCHCADERVAIGELEHAAQIIDRVAESLLLGG
jgi:succinyl-diaminopimelate desuccinylase